MRSDGSRARATYAPEPRTPLRLREARSEPDLHPARAVGIHILEQRYGARAAAPVASPGTLLSFQSDAVRRARAILARRGGALLADSVGLGKTHIAAALVAPFLDSGGRAAIVGPAALRRHWLTSVEWRVRPDWISYARLSRGSFGDDRYDIIVFDEAHALRNPTTRRYRAASALSRGARVLLLSATPVNNTIWDLYHLLRLFCGERDFVDAGVPSLHAAFEEAAACALLGTAPSLQPVLCAVMIRRTRPFLKTLVRAGAHAERVPLAFPAHRAPVPVRYSLGPEGGDGAILKAIGRGLVALGFPAHLQPGQGASRRNDATGARRDWRRIEAPPALLRLNLLKRLESSVHAFQRSVAAYDGMLERCLDGVSRGLLVHARNDAGGIAEFDQLRLDSLLFEPLPRAFEVGEYRDRLELERATVHAMLVALQPALHVDGKVEVLRALLTGELRTSRVLVFTQYRDTARYLHSRLCRQLRVASIDGGSARLGAEVVDRLVVIHRFAPLANGAAPPRPHEAVDVLIATDVLAEGFNLQDADVVISYDLPWNPVRLVQRIGRIDRLGSPHASIASYHFLPGDLERYLGLLDRIARKASAIDASVGSDMPALHAELVRALDRRDARVVERVEERDAEWFELDERLQHLLARFGGRPRQHDIIDPQAFAVGVLPRMGAALPLDRAPSGLVAAWVGDRFEWLAVVSGQPIEDERLCGRIVEAALASSEAVEAMPPSNGAVAGRGNALPRDALGALLDAARPVFARRIAVMATAALLPAGGPAARMGRRLLELAALLPGGPDAVTCRRLEGCLDCLTRMPHDKIAELENRARSPQLLAELMDVLEQRGPMARAGALGAARAPDAVRVWLIGALLQR
ncbi:MAG TPA: helicase-related protein [Longimicrobiales bacterium]|nr:helicase-related protein [Longimicrobiales bacterium]